MSWHVLLDQLPFLKLSKFNQIFLLLIIQNEHNEFHKNCNANNYKIETKLENSISVKIWSIHIEWAEFPKTGGKHLLNTFGCWKRDGLVEGCPINGEKTGGWEGERDLIGNRGVVGWRRRENKRASMLGIGTNRAWEINPSNRRPPSISRLVIKRLPLAACCHP